MHALFPLQSGPHLRLWTAEQSGLTLRDELDVSMFVEADICACRHITNKHEDYLLTVDTNGMLRFVCFCLLLFFVRKDCKNKGGEDYRSNDNHA